MNVSRAILVLLGILMIGLLFFLKTSFAGQSISVDVYGISSPGGYQSVLIPELNMVIRGSAEIDPADGTYTLCVPGNPNAVFGKFVVSNGAVSEVTGALMNNNSTVSIDPEALANIYIDPSALSQPSEQEAVFLKETQSVFAQSLLLSLPDGTYSLVTPGDNSISFGTFSISNHAISNATGALLFNWNVLSFNPALLTSITIDPSVLSNPTGYESVFLQQVQSVAYGENTYSLPNGTYTITAPGNWNTTFGQFTIQEGAITYTDQSLEAIPGGIGFDLTKLASVAIDSGPLTYPSGNQNVFLQETQSVFNGNIDYWLPAGNYTISTPGDNNLVFGQFQVTDSHAIQTYGALTSANTGSGFTQIDFNLCMLNGVAISAAGSTPWQLLVANLGPVEAGLSAWLPSGNYEVDALTSNGIVADRFTLSSSGVQSSSNQDLIMLSSIQCADNAQEKRSTQDTDSHDARHAGMGCAPAAAIASEHGGSNPESSGSTIPAIADFSLLVSAWAAMKLFKHAIKVR